MVMGMFDALGAGGTPGQVVKKIAAYQPLDSLR